MLLRHARRDHGWTQQDLAERIEASRHWIIHVERGKPTAEVGLVLKALSALGLACDIRKGGLAGLRWPAGEAPSGAYPSVPTAREPEAPGVPVPDLGEVLGRMTGARPLSGSPAGAARNPSRSSTR